MNKELLQLIRKDLQYKAVISRFEETCKAVIKEHVDIVNARLHTTYKVYSVDVQLSTTDKTLRIHITLTHVLDTLDHSIIRNYLGSTLAQHLGVEFYSTRHQVYYGDALIILVFKLPEGIS